MKKVILVGLLVLAVTLVPGCSCGGGGGEALQGIEQNLTAIQDQLSQMENSADSLGQRITALEGAGVSPAPDTKYYLGFMPAKAGQWVDDVVVLPYLHTLKIECIGEENVSEKECMGFEITGKHKNFTEVLLQLWIDIDTGEPVNAVVKVSGVPGVYCLPVNKVETILPREFWPQFGGDETPAEVLPNLGYTLAKFPKEIYPQFTGFEGELDCGGFRLSDGSVRYVSSQVPFGWVYRSNSPNVRDIIDHISDYGFSGAERSITAVQRDTCMDLGPETLKALESPMISRSRS